MRPVTDLFLRTVRGSHRMVAEVRVVDPGQTGVDPDGTVVGHIDGDVQLDATADIRSTVDVTVDGNQAWDTTGLFTPYGPELFIRRGIEFGSGAREWVSLGYHKIYSVDQDDAPNGPLRIAGRDRMSGLIDGRMLSPLQFTTAHTIKQFFDLLVLDIYPTAVIEYDFDATTQNVSRPVVVEQDRYAALRDMVRSLGKVMYWDHEGKLQIRAAPDPTAPVFDVDAGAGGVLVSMSRSLDREGVYNAVVAYGEAPDNKPPARAVARDVNPISATYWFGDFGRVPRCYSSPFITNLGQARSAAAAMLARSIGLPYNIDFTVVPNPALEPLDPVRVRHVDGSEIHTIETLTVPLVAADPMTATTREQTTIIIETSEELS